MAAPVDARHAFVSTKAESADASIVSKDEWNNAHVLTGGAQGQIVARDAGSVTGASYIDGATVQTNSGSFSGGATSPDLASILVTNNTPASLLIIASFTAVTSTGNAQAFIKRDGAAVTNWIGDGVGHVATWAFVIGENTPGTHNWQVAVAGVSGTFTSLAVQLSILKIGGI